METNFLTKDSSDYRLDPVSMGFYLLMGIDPNVTTTSSEDLTQLVQWIQASLETEY